LSPSWWIRTETSHLLRPSPREFHQRRSSGGRLRDARRPPRGAGPGSRHRWACRRPTVPGSARTSRDGVTRLRVEAGPAWSLAKVSCPLRAGAPGGPPSRGRRPRAAQLLIVPSGAASAITCRRPGFPPSGGARQPGAELLERRRPIGGRARSFREAASARTAAPCPGSRLEETRAQTDWRCGSRNDRPRSGKSLRDHGPRGAACSSPSNGAAGSVA